MRHLAIDAGQTGIRTLALVDGDRVRDEELPGILTSEPLVPQLVQVIADAAAELGTIELVSIGSTGLTRDQTRPDLIRDATVAHGVREVLMAHDSVTSYLGALGDDRGAVVAAGTGVVTLAVGATEVVRIDGWGYLIGDAGAGYWIGRAALEAVLRAHDGRGPATALTARVQREFPDLEQAYIELQGDPGRVRRIAAYTRHVAELAATDEVADGICRSAARELVLSIETGLRRVGESERPDPVVCGMGGVLRAEAIAEPFHAELRRRWDAVQIRDARGAGIDGAALLPEVAADSAVRALIARG